MRKNNKIALFSPFSGTNYGTMLQAFCLMKAIQSLGQPCEYITYSSSYKHSIFERIINKCLRILNIDKKKEQSVYSIDDYSYVSSNEFKDLRDVSTAFVANNIAHSSLVYTPKNISKCKGYKKYIVGSDQTWSMENYSRTSLFFLPFIKNPRLKAAYAPSLGTTSLSKKHKKIIKKHLCSFSQLSCREYSNCIEIEKIINKKVEHVVDPTMLFGRMFWQNFESKIFLPQKYIIAYILGEKKCISEFAYKLSADFGYPVLFIVTRPIYLKEKNILKGLSPAEWVYAMNNAEWVITDSYHGTLFCINLNKNFYSFTKREHISSIYNDNDRIYELLSQYHLEDRLLREDQWTTLGDYTKINYSEINPIIELNRANSYNYLKAIVD